MGFILKVKNENGEVVDIPAIVGPRGPRGPQGYAGSDAAVNEANVLNAIGYAPVSPNQVLTDVPSGAVFTDTVYSHPTSHPASMITGLPTSLPADGGDADTVNGKTVGTNVPAGAVFTDTVYTHPTTHSISEVSGLQTALDGKVDDSQVLTNVPLNAKFTDTIVDISGKVDNSRVLTDVPANAKFTDTVYSHPATHSADMITDGTSNKAYTATEKTKLSGIATNANNYSHPATHPPSIIEQDASNRFVTDAEKSTWNGKQNALGYTPLNSTLKGAVSGIAELDANGRVPSSQLPSYVDDVLEYASRSNFPVTGESGKIYISSDTNLTYRWSGTGYVEISASIALGETSATAYRGDRGKTAYEHSQTTHAPSNATANDTNANLRDRSTHTGTQSADTIIDGTNNKAFTVAEKTKLSGIDTNANNYSHPTSDGSKHVPANGTTNNGKVLKAGATAGTYIWSNDNDTITTINGKTGAISKADIVALGIPAQDTVYTHPTTHPYSMITGTPTSLPASGGHALSATHLLGDDTRAVNSAPSVYMSGGARYASRAGWQTEFKTRTAIDSPPLSGTYVYLQTYTPWSDPSGGYPIQVVYGNGTPCWRVGVSTSAWSAWQSVNDNGNASTVNGFTVGINVPANAKFTDTVYSHPASHPASIITQDTNNRFVSDNEKGVWNGKQDALGFTPVNTTDSRLSDARTPTAHNHTGVYQPIDADLTAIAGLTGTTGLLRKTAANTWTLDTTALGDMTVAIYGGSASGVVAKADSLKETRTGATEKVWVGTKAQYDAIVTKDAGTSYITTDETYGSYISLDETGHILASYMPLTVSAHIASTSNPHGVTKSQVGLGNVNNTADIDKPISLYVQNALDGKAALNHTHSTYALLDHTHAIYAPINNPTFTGAVSGITAAMVGLGHVTNESKTTMFTSPTFTGTVSGITATMVGLGDVTNESKATMFTAPTFTGIAKATGNTSYTTSQLRNIFLNTTTPTSGDGSNGDVWIVYT